MILILYDSYTGNTKQMAYHIAEAVKNACQQVTVKKVDDAILDDMIHADAIIFGSPTHFGMMTSKMKMFLDNSNDIWGKLDKKIGAAFTSSGGISGGNETTLLSLVQVMLIHGMLVTGPPGRYGVVAIDKPDKKVIISCKKLGERVVSLLKGIN